MINKLKQVLTPESIIIVGSTKEKEYYYSLLNGKYRTVYIWAFVKHHEDIEHKHLIFINHFESKFKTDKNITFIHTDALERIKANNTISYLYSNDNQKKNIEVFNSTHKSLIDFIDKSHKKKIIYTNSIEAIESYVELGQKAYVVVSEDHKRLINNPNISIINQKDIDKYNTVFATYGALHIPISEGITKCIYMPTFQPAFFLTKEQIKCTFSNNKTGENILFLPFSSITKRVTHNDLLALMKVLLKRIVVVDEEITYTPCDVNKNHNSLDNSKLEQLESVLYNLSSNNNNNDNNNEIEWIKDNILIGYKNLDLQAIEEAVSVCLDLCDEHCGGEWIKSCSKTKYNYTSLKNTFITTYKLYRDIDVFIEGVKYTNEEVRIICTENNISKEDLDGIYDIELSRTGKTRYKTFIKKEAELNDIHTVEQDVAKYTNDSKEIIMDNYINSINISPLNNSILCNKKNKTLYDKYIIRIE